MKKSVFSLIKFLNRLVFRSQIDDKNRTIPVNDTFGYNRGTPVDRYYIKKAINSYSKYIRGSVIEVGGRDYTKDISDIDLKNSFILNYSPILGDNIIVGDLSDPSSLKGYHFDTFICIQTLNFIYDFKAAISSSYGLLKAGGYFLGTVASVSNVSKFDDARWGDYWRFTKKGIETALLESKFEIIDISSFGNVLAAKAMFDGLVVEDFKKPDLLEINDSGYPVIISFLCRRPLIDA